MTKFFEKGDIVKIAKTSGYYDENAGSSSSNPTCTGVVQHQSQEPVPIVSVIWDNGIINQYAISDLEHAISEEQLKENPIRYTVLDPNGDPITFDTKEEAEAYRYKISKPYIEPAVVYKQVTFMGTSLLVNEKHKWIAIDDNGDVFSFSCKPVYNRDYGFWDINYVGIIERIGTLKYAPKNFDYNGSLTEI
ncbi:hypothetical protein [Providencia phage PSTCR6]|nr:hypothetical protein [Providencia phage PSTCR6]